MTDPNGFEAHIYNLNTQLLIAYRAEEEFWRQRSRIMWLALGDKNSGYFHAVAKGRRARNRLSVIEDAEEQTYYEENQIGIQISKYYSDIYTTTSDASNNLETWRKVTYAISPSITEETNRSLERIPDVAEIRTALFSIHPDKAPGPDGFSASFFHSNWEMISQAFVAEVQKFFRTGVMEPATNVTYVRLIPKVTGAKLVSEYRPIALCSVL